MSLTICSSGLPTSFCYHLPLLFHTSISKKYFRPGEMAPSETPRWRITPRVSSIPRIPSTCAQNAILSVLIILIIPSRQIYVAIDNPSLVPSVSCLTTSSYLRRYVRAAYDVSHAENLQSNGCRCFCHLYKFRDGIQVTRVFRYRGERQG